MPSPACGFLRQQPATHALSDEGCGEDANRGIVMCMLDWSQCPVVERLAEKVGGAWVFKGTRVPVRALFENIEGGATIEQFLEWFPGVGRDQALAVLKYTESTLAELPS